VELDFLTEDGTLIESKYNAEMEGKQLQVFRDHPAQGSHLEVVKADFILVRFDGLELDSGTGVELAVAKSLGKPTVVLRSDFRRTSFGGLCEPYNLMVKNWTCNVEMQINSFGLWADLFSRKRQVSSDGDTFQATMRAELGTVKMGLCSDLHRTIPSGDSLL
jgi:hypothetical protein